MACRLGIGHDRCLVRLLPTSQLAHSFGGHVWMVALYYALSYSLDPRHPSAEFAVCVHLVQLAEHRSRFGWHPAALHATPASYCALQTTLSRNIIVELTKLSGQQYIESVRDWCPAQLCNRRAQHHKPSTPPSTPRLSPQALSTFVELRSDALQTAARLVELLVQLCRRLPAAAAQTPFVIAGRLLLSPHAKARQLGLALLGRVLALDPKPLQQLTVPDLHQLVYSLRVAQQSDAQHSPAIRAGAVDLLGQLRLALRAAAAETPALRTAVITPVMLSNGTPALQNASGEPVQVTVPGANTVDLPSLFVELGSQSIASADQVRRVLSLAGTRLRGTRPVDGTVELTEPVVARLLVRLAAMSAGDQPGAARAAPDDKLAALVSALQPGLAAPASGGSADLVWRSDALATVLQEAQLDWYAVARCLDLPADPASPMGHPHHLIRSSDAFTWVVQLVLDASGAPFPTAALLEPWAHPESQLACIELAVSAPPRLVTFQHLPALIAPLPASVSRGAGSANRAWCSPQLYEALERLAMVPKLDKAVSHVLKLGEDAAPDMVLLGMMMLRVRSGSSRGFAAQQTSLAWKAFGSHLDLTAQLTAPLSDGQVALLQRMWQNSAQATCLVLFQAAAQHCAVFLQTQQTTSPALTTLANFRAVRRVAQMLLSLPNTDVPYLVLLKFVMTYDMRVQLSVVLALLSSSSSRAAAGRGQAEPPKFSLSEFLEDYMNESLAMAAIKLAQHILELFNNTNTNTRGQIPEAAIPILLLSVVMAAPKGGERNADVAAEALMQAKTSIRAISEHVNSEVARHARMLLTKTFSKPAHLANFARENSALAARGSTAGHAHALRVAVLRHALNLLNSVLMQVVHGDYNAPASGPNAGPALGVALSIPGFPRVDVALDSLIGALVQRAGTPSGACAAEALKHAGSALARHPVLLQRLAAIVHSTPALSQLADVVNKARAEAAAAAAAAEAQSSRARMSAGGSSAAGFGVPAGRVSASASGVQEEHWFPGLQAQLARRVTSAAPRGMTPLQALQLAVASEPLPQQQPERSASASLGLPSSLEPARRASGWSIGEIISKQLVPDARMASPAPEPSTAEVTFKLNRVLNNLSASSDVIADSASNIRRYLDTPANLQFVAHKLVARVCSNEKMQPVYAKWVQALSVRSLRAYVLQQSLISLREQLESGQEESSEKKLRALGSWIALMTVGIGQPLRKTHLCLEELLLQAYELGRLWQAVPFVCDFLRVALGERIFRYPNPWTAHLLALVHEIAALPGLDWKLILMADNLRADCSLPEIAPSALLHARRRPMELTDFKNKQAPVSLPGLQLRDAGDAPCLPGLARWVVLPPDLELLGMPAHLLPLLRVVAVMAFDATMRRCLDSVVVSLAEDAAATAAALATKDFCADSSSGFKQASHSLLMQVFSAQVHLRLQDSVHAGVMDYMARHWPAESASTLASALEVVAQANLYRALQLLNKAGIQLAVQKLNAKLQHSVDRRAMAARNQEEFLDSTVYSSQREFPQYLPMELRPAHTGNMRQLVRAAYENAPVRPAVGMQSLQDQVKSLCSKLGKQDASGHVDAPTRQQLETLRESARQLAASGALVQLGDALRQAVSTATKLVTPASQHAWAAIALQLVSAHSDLKLQSLPPLLFSDTCMPQPFLLFSVLQNEAADAAQFDRVLAQQVELLRLAPKPACKYHMGANMLSLACALLCMAASDTKSQSGRPVMLPLTQDAVLKVRGSTPVADMPVWYQHFLQAWQEFCRSHAPQPLVAVLAELKKLADDKASSDVYPMHPSNGDDRADVLRFFKTWLAFKHAKNGTAATFFERHPAAWTWTRPEKLDLFVELLAQLSHESAQKQWREPDPALRESDTLFPTTSTTLVGSDAFCWFMVAIMQLADGEEQQVAVLQRMLSAVARKLKELFRGTQGLPDDAAPDQRAFLNIFGPMLQLTLRPEPNMQTDSEEEQQRVSAYNAAVLATFATVLHTIRPAEQPGFTFSWLKLATLPRLCNGLLKIEEKAGWPFMQRLVVDMLQATQLAATAVEARRHSVAAAELYRAVVHAALALYMQYPQFLAAYHHSFTSVTPVACVQLHNILAAAATPPTRHTPHDFDEMCSQPDCQQPPAVAVSVSSALGKQLEPPYRSAVAAAAGCASVEPSAALMQALAQLHTAMSEPHRLSVQQRVFAVVYALVSEGAGTLASMQVATCPQFSVLLHLLHTASPAVKYLLAAGLVGHARYPSSHTLWTYQATLCCWLLASKMSVRDVIARAALERQSQHRPHSWGLVALRHQLEENPVYELEAHTFMAHGGPATAQSGSVRRAGSAHASARAGTLHK